MELQLSKEAIASAIARAPGVGPVLRKLADKVARGVRLPSEYTVRDLDSESQHELESLLYVIGRRLPDGGGQICIPEWLREQPWAWEEAIEFFGLKRAEAKPGRSRWWESSLRAMSAAKRRSSPPPN